MTRPLFIGTVVLAAALAGGASDGHAQGVVRRGMAWNERPSIVFGDDVHVDLRAKAVFDWRTFDPALDEKAYDLDVLRVGLKGELSHHLDFEIEREVTGDGRHKLAGPHLGRDLRQ
jgi:hypothetical protein